MNYTPLSRTSCKGKNSRKIYDPQIRKACFKKLSVLGVLGGWKCK